MWSIVTCIYEEHNLWSVSLAVLVVTCGSYLTLILHKIACRDRGHVAIGWQSLAAISAGASIWATHFVAMLGYKNGFGATFDLKLTALSLLVMILGTLAGLELARQAATPIGRAAGGAVVGLTVATMHYLDMLGFHIEGTLLWNRNYIALSVILSVGLSSLALVLLRNHRRLATTTFAIGILLLHFVGMTAITVIPTSFSTSIGVLDALPITIGVVLMTLVTLGGGFATMLVELRNRDAINKINRYDHLTGLNNRRYFSKKLERMMLKSDETNEPLVLIMFDINRFRYFNERFGRNAGDEILRQVGQRLREAEFGTVLLSRSSNDEFYVAKSLQCEAQEKPVIAMLRNVFAEPFHLNDTHHKLDAQFGIARYPEHACGPERLLAHAEHALAAVKNDPQTDLHVYHMDLAEKSRRRVALSVDLASALQRQEMELYYQPQVNMATGAVIGFEALLRWTHGKLGPISPATFIPIAESTGLILPIGSFVLEQACYDARHFKAGQTLGVNISAIQLYEERLVEEVSDLLLATGLRPEQLELELTESAVVSNPEQAVETISKLQKMGVRVALDDFGTGYSSFSALRDIPFDRIKVDRSMIHNLHNIPRSIEIVEALFGLAGGLDADLIVEGVETAEERDILLSRNIHVAQGFLFGRPMPLKKALELPEQLFSTEKRAQSRPKQH